MFLCTRQVSITQDLDVALVVDVTGSFDGDLPVIRSLAPGLWQMLAAKAPGLRMALTTFQDFSDGAGVYQLRQNFTTNNATWLAAVDAMALGNGDDTAEAQLVGIRRTLADLSWREAATRVMVLTTDAPFHTGGTCCSSGEVWLLLALLLCPPCVHPPYSLQSCCCLQGMGPLRRQVPPSLLKGSSLWACASQAVMPARFKRWLTLLAVP
jgi:hypothetical protein